MKITIKKNKPEVKQVYIKDVPVGYVFKILNYKNNDKGPTALKLCADRFVVLSYTSGYSWFIIGDAGWKDYTVKILGELTEIVVEE